MNFTKINIPKLMVHPCHKNDFPKKKARLKIYLTREKYLSNNLLQKLMKTQSLMEKKRSINFSEFAAGPRKNRTKTDQYKFY